MATHSTEHEDLNKTIEGLSKGTRLIKTRSTRKFYLRHYRIDEYNMRLKYYPSRKPFFCQKIPFVEFSEIDEVREGWNSDVFNSVSAASAARRVRARTPPFQLIDESCCFTVVIRPDFIALDLVAPNKATRDVWVKGLNHLIDMSKVTRREKQFDSWLKKQFRCADLNRNKHLEFDECLKLLKTLNINMEKCIVKSHFKKVSTKRLSMPFKPSLNSDEFVKFYRLLESRPYLQKLFDRYCDKRQMGPKELCDFLRTEQKMMHVTLENCIALITQFEKQENPAPEFMGFREFCQLLLSKEQGFIGPTVLQDMTQPLHHYYISSSHNTYLRQDQLIGESSIDAYIRALKFGIRCIEIDIWNGPQNEPEVFHGYTLTTRILLRDVLEAIQKYAFHSTPYPLLISLENHCDEEQQAVAGQHFATILKDYLYVDPVPKNATTFPSPEQLKNKILLKAKKGGQKKEGTDYTKEEMLEEEEEDEEEKEKEENEDEGTTNEHYQSPSPLLSQLVNYLKPTRFTNFKERREHGKFYELSSLSENKALECIDKSADDFIEFNRKHLTRIYPSGLRTSSSNFMPDQFWSAGCQLVTLNVQTYDGGSLLNKAMFMQNGGCGYVLKPEYLIRGKYSLTHSSEEPRQTLRIKIISGQCITKPGQALEGEIVDPYVVIRVFGHPSDHQKQKTKYVNNNGFNPVWNEEVHLPLHFPELAILVLKVKDHEMIGRQKRLSIFAAPVSCIQPGYRHIHLWDDSFQELVPSTIFVHVSIEERAKAASA